LDFNDRGVVLAFKHLEFIWYLDFGIWYLMDITPSVPLTLRGIKGEKAVLAFQHWDLGE
jgi:hypothetical protein